MINMYKAFSRIDVDTHTHTQKQFINDRAIVQRGMCAMLIAIEICMYQHCNHITNDS